MTKYSTESLGPTSFNEERWELGGELLSSIARVEIDSDREFSPIGEHSGFKVAINELARSIDMYVPSKRGDDPVLMTVPEDGSFATLTERTGKHVRHHTFTRADDEWVLNGTSLVEHDHSFGILKGTEVYVGILSRRRELDRESPNRPNRELYRALALQVRTSEKDRQPTRWETVRDKALGRISLW